MNFTNSAALAFRRTQPTARHLSTQQLRKLRASALHAVANSDTQYPDYGKLSSFAAKRRINYNSASDFSWRKTWSAEGMPSSLNTRYYKGRMYVLPTPETVEEVGHESKERSQGFFFMTSLFCASFGLSGLFTYLFVLCF